MKPINVLCGQNAELLNVKVGSTFGCLYALKCYVTYSCSFYTLTSNVATSGCLLSKAVVLKQWFVRISERLVELYVL
jgi:hypothetical protein